MANLYVGDDLHARYIEAYGRDDAKDKMRDVLAEHAPTDGDGDA